VKSSAALPASWTLLQADRYLGGEMGLENVPTVHNPCHKVGPYWPCLWENSRL